MCRMCACTSISHDPDLQTLIAADLPQRCVCSIQHSAPPLHLSHHGPSVKFACSMCHFYEQFHALPQGPNGKLNFQKPTQSLICRCKVSFTLPFERVTLRPTSAEARCDNVHFAWTTRQTWTIFCWNSIAKGMDLLNTMLQNEKIETW